MKRFLLAAALALVLGSQADAQIIYRSYAAPAYYYPSTSGYVWNSGYTYANPVVTAGYVDPAYTTYSYPAYSYPAYSSYYTAPAYTYSTPYYTGYTSPVYWGGRRGWRW